MSRIDWSDLPIGPLLAGMLLVVVLVTFILAFTVAGDGGGSEPTPAPTAPAATATAPAASPTAGATGPAPAGSPTAAAASLAGETAIPIAEGGTATTGGGWGVLPLHGVSVVIRHAGQGGYYVLKPPARVDKGHVPSQLSG